MEELKAGSFFGQTNRTFHLDGILLTDTEYTVDKVDWHYHENAYFTFILAGQILDGNRKEKYHCAPGSLLFHNWQEPHYNIKPEGYTRGFHLEIQKEWFRELLPDREVAEEGKPSCSTPCYTRPSSRFYCKYSRHCSRKKARSTRTRPG